jgi:hypothetical protein
MTRLIVPFPLCAFVSEAFFGKRSHAKTQWKEDAMIAFALPGARGASDGDWRCAPNENCFAACFHCVFA